MSETRPDVWPQIFLRMKRCVLFFLGASALLFSCSSDEEPAQYSDEIDLIRIWDVGNANNAGDMRVGFTFTVTSDTEVRVFVAKAASAVPAGAGETIGPDRYQLATASTGSSFSLRLSEGLLDTDGEAIQNGVSYVVQIFVAAEGKLSNPSDAFAISDAPVWAGSYGGLWNDNLYDDFGITATLSGSGTSYSGPFYYTANFTSCCGGNDDGSISMTIREDGTIDNFRYDQDLIDFMGGCPGLYNGSGQVDGDLMLRINFEGEDCEGPHTGGLMELTKLPL